MVGDHERKGHVLARGRYAARHRAEIKAEKARNRERERGPGRGGGKEKGSRNDWLRSLRSHALAPLLTIHTRTKRWPGSERMKAGAELEEKGKKEKKREK